MRLRIDPALNFQSRNFQVRTAIELRRLEEPILICLERRIARMEFARL
jgi:hypothetical protein